MYNLLFLLVIFQLSRLLFYLFNVDDEVNLIKYLSSAFNGLKFDISIVSYYGILLSVFEIMIVLKLPLKKIAVYFNLVLFQLFMIILFSDIVYFKFFSNHFSMKDLEYLFDIEVYTTVFTSFYSYFFTVIIFTIPLFYYKLLKRNYLDDFVYKEKILYLVMFLLLSGVFVIGARGGLDQSTLNWGAAYYSDDQFLNQTSHNSIFYFAKSIDQYLKDKKRNYKSINQKQISELRELYRVDNETFIQDSTLIREYIDSKEVKKYNVVFILLESWMNQYIGEYGGMKGITPYFDELSKESYNFLNFYSSAYRSGKGILATNTGFVPQSGNSVIKRMEAQKPFYSLSSIFKERGYSSIFVYGGDSDFDNMQGFLRVNGIDKFYDRFDFERKDDFGKWGVPDSVLFDKSIKLLDQMKEPFFAEIYTLSTHEPFDLPDERFNIYNENDSKDWKGINCNIYSDYYLGRFFEDIKKREYYKNTVFIITSDHGRKTVPYDLFDYNRFKIPFLIHCPNDSLFSSGYKSYKTGSQTDILPTLMSILGGSYNHSSFGRDLLNIDDNGFAYFIGGDFTGYAENDTITIIEKAGREFSMVQTFDKLEKIEVTNKLALDKIKLIKNGSSFLIDSKKFSNIEKY